MSDTTPADTVTLHGGPADGRIVETNGFEFIHVPVSESPYHERGLARYDATTGELREYTAGRPYPPCPTCGGPTVRSYLTGTSSGKNRVQLGCAGFNGDCPIAFYADLPE